MHIITKKSEIENLAIVGTTTIVSIKLLNFVENSLRGFQAKKTEKIDFMKRSLMPDFDNRENTSQQKQPISVFTGENEEGEVVLFVTDGLQRTTIMKSILDDHYTTIYDSIIEEKQKSGVSELSDTEIEQLEREAEERAGTLYLRAEVVGPPESHIDLINDQISANFGRMEQSPAEMAKALKIAVDNGFSIAEISQKFNLSESRIVSLFKLNRLPEDVSNLIDSKELTLSNAFLIIDNMGNKGAKLTSEEFTKAVDKAKIADKADFEKYLINIKDQKKLEREDIRHVENMKFIEPEPSLDAKRAIDMLDKIKFAYESGESENIELYNAFLYIFGIDSETIDKAYSDFIDKKEKALAKLQEKENKGKA